MNQPTTDPSNIVTARLFYAIMGAATSFWVGISLLFYSIAMDTIRREVENVLGEIQDANSRADRHNLRLLALEAANNPADQRTIEAIQREAGSEGE